MRVRRIRELAIAEVYVPNGDYFVALGAIARWAEQHPDATLIALNTNTAANTEENYVTAVFDGVEDEDLG